MRKVHATVEEPTPEEEPVVVAGAEEPCQGCAAPLTLSEAIAHAEEKGVGEGGCAANHRQLAGWLRELEESRKARAAAAAPTFDQGAIAHYPLSLPGDRWEALATARQQQLAQAREMAHAAQLLEEAALAAVDGLLAAPTEAPEPAEAPRSSSAGSGVEQWFSEQKRKLLPRKEGV